MDAPPVTVMLPVLTGRRRHTEVVAWAFAMSDDLERLGKVELRMGSHGYAVIRGASRELFHRAILGLRPGDGVVVDHRDRNKLNCSRRNLRTGTQALNTQNLPRSPYCGTRPNHSRWSASAKKDGRTLYLGTYDTREEAAEVARRYRQKHYPFTTEC
jgi:hypothetical protein